MRSGTFSQRFQTRKPFVRFAPVEAHLDGITQNMLVYLKENDGLTSSAILDWMLEKSGWEHS